MFFMGEHLSAQQKEAPVISRITIYSTDIFDFETKPYLKKIPYTWINTLHIQTHRYIIKQELLFKEGEPINDFKIQETERNLRGLPFIRAARIAQYPQSDGSVALVVFVSDSWTTEPQLNLSGNNGIDELEVGFKEKNFLGFGKSFEVSYTDEDGGGNEGVVRFVDPRLFRSRWRLSGEYFNRDTGNERVFSLTRPFFSAGSRWSGGVTHSNKNEEVDEFNQNVKISEFEKKSKVTEVAGGVKVGGGFKHVQRVGLRYRKRVERFGRTEQTAANRGVPRANDFQTIFLDLSSIRNEFIELTRIEKMTRVEDFNLGPVLNVAPGMSPEFLTGRRNVTELEGNFSKNAYHPHGIFFSGFYGYSGRDVFDRALNQLSLLDLRMYYLGFANQTWVVHTRAEWGDTLDSANSVRLGSQEGLRAYNIQELFGSKTFLVNVENRMFFIDDLWDLVSIGGVVYYDGGGAWSSGKPVALSEMKHGVGAGFRFGMTKSSNELIARLDFTLRLTNSPLDDDEYVISFGSGQAF